MADNQNQVQLHEPVPQPNQLRANQNEAPVLVGDHINLIPVPVQPALDATREWFLCLPPESIQSWNDMVQKFTMKFFPPSRIHQIRNDVHTFKQKDLESYPEAWERFKNFLRKCPNLDIPKQAQQYLFYYGLKQEFRNMIDASAGGSVMKLDVDEAYDLYEKIAENQSMWPTDREAPRKTSGLHNVDAVTALAAQMEVLTVKMDNLSKSVNMVYQSPPVCEGCGANHASTRCPLASVGRTIQIIHGPIIKDKNREEAIRINHQDSNSNNSKGEGHHWKICWLNILLKLRPTFKTNKPRSRIWNNKLDKLQPHYQVELKGHCLVILKQILRSRSKQSLHVVAPTMDEEQVDELDKATEENQVESSDSPQVKATAPIKAYVPPIPFPQRLQKHKLNKQFQEFLDVFKKLHINIPFAETLAQMPSYTKFMKDILSNKKKLEDNETVMLTEECSAILQHKLPPKLKDPGSFTIPCHIGNLYIDKALCDLGASINLMPLSLFQKLGLGEAKPTTVSLQLTDRSIRHPRSICEDILVKVDKFIFPADFIILDMEEDRDVFLILGRPFWLREEL
ncbi:uncharacterized protein LOC111380150 [Olea europaea var. sylvestris]|uniref:uncharacterized protein LOC111380150 n=1 Tax=Olea europaea var. sylvestris TaxID=158386 RepID=UPI000C1CDD4F|nr:uncharacterized protein LOC111380150 [Olea europaea var. sylvestris]